MKLSKKYLAKEAKEGAHSKMSKKGKAHEKVEKKSKEKAEHYAMGSLKRTAKKNGGKPGSLMAAFNSKKAKLSKKGMA